MQLSSFIGKQLLSVNGTQLGCVISVLLSRDYKKLACLRCADRDEEEFFVPARAVLSLGDAVVIGNARLSSPTGVSVPVMLPAYSNGGVYLGALSDVVFGEEGEPVLLVSERGELAEYPLSRAILGETLVLFPTPEEKKSAAARRARSAPAQKKPRKAQTEKPAPALEIATAPIAPPAPAPVQKKSPQPVPEAATVQKAEHSPACDYSFNRLNLLGRRVKKSVFDGDGNAVALAGERITPELLSRARRVNRLLQLTVNTLTNVL